MPSDDITVKQHHVPAFYLKLFTNQEGFLQVFDVKNDRIGRPKTPSQVGYSRFFYAVETGVQDDVSQCIEKWLGEFENTIAKEISDVIDKIVTNKHIDDSDRYLLSVLMSMLWLRSPGMRDQLNRMNEDMMKQMMSHYVPERVDCQIKKEGLHVSEEERLELINMLKTGSYQLRSNNALHLRFMTESLGFDGPGFANMFFAHDWKIYIAGGQRRFITSDGPIVEWWLPTRSPWGVPFTGRNKYFALTPKIFIELSKPKESRKARRKTIFRDEDDTVSIFNILIAHHCHQYVYSGDRTLLESLMLGRKNPGAIERAYYDRFQRPLDEAEAQRTI